MADAAAVTSATAAAGAAAAPLRRRRRWLPWLVGIGLLAAVVGLALHAAEARDFLALAQRAEPAWLLLAVALQAATYVADAQVLRSVCRAARAPVRLPSLLTATLAKLFVDQAVPSAGISGTVLLAGAMMHSGVPRAVVAAAVLVDHGSYYATYVACVGLALVLLALEGAANAPLVLIAALFMLFGSGMCVLVLALARRARAAAGGRLARVWLLRDALQFLGDADLRLVQRPRLLLRATGWHLALVWLDAATLWLCIRALGAHAPPTGVFASFMISTLFRTLGVVPGGLGTFEATSVLTLQALGTGLPVALAATLLFRGLSFWLPMLPGLWCARRILRAGAAAQSPNG